MKLAVVFYFLIFIQIGAYAQDRTLDYFIEQALQNSPLLKEQLNQIEAVKLDSMLFKASLKTRVDAISNNMYAPYTKSGWGYDPAITNGGNLTAQISVSKNINWKKNVQSQLQVLRFINDSIVVNSKINQQQLKRDIISQYIAAYGDILQIRFADEILKLLNDQDTILKTLTQNGVYKQTDYLIILVTKKQQEITLKQFQFQYKNDLNLLNYLCGIYDTTTFNLAEPDLTLETLKNYKQTIFNRQYIIDSLKLQNAEAIIDYAYNPKIGFFGDAGFNSSFTYNGYKNFGASAGINISVPIYDGRQKNLQHQKIALQKNSLSYYKEFARKQYTQQVAQFYIQLSQANALITENTSLTGYAKTLIDANKKLLATGDISVADYIISINNYLNAKNNINQFTLTKMQLINELNYWNR